MPSNTFTLIEKITVGAAGASSIEFASIPQTYTDLVLHFSGRGTQTAGVVADIDLQFNSSTANFSRRTLRGSGSAASSTSASDNYGAAVTGNSATASTFGSWQIYIPNYTSSNNKSFSIDTVTENNATEAWQYMLAGLWSNSAAISNIKVVPQTGTWMQYSTAYLYGVAKEGVSPSPSSAPYATGGDSIVFDGTYWIHTFTSSGTFTPKKGLTCDYLVVAGGGSGSAGEAGGGGGAGGMRCTVTATGGGGSLESPVALTNGTAYTITVGAGGAANGSSGSNSSIAGTGLTTITSTGGGGTVFIGNGKSGGSGGGGGGGSGATGGAGTANQGYAGGNGYGDAPRIGGGGGGAGVAGTAATSSTPGAGGNGVATSITGSSVTYAGGGGGATNSGGGGAAGGSGGGGAGGGGGTSGPVAGGKNLGGGGGGNGSSENPSATGGSGIIVIRYSAAA